MAATRALGRLLQVLDLEEEQALAAFQSASRRLRHWERGRDAAMDRERHGRELMVTGAAGDQTLDRIAALQETTVASRTASILRGRVEAARQEVAAGRQIFLTKRIEKRRVETLVREARKREAEQQARQAERATDDWYLGNLQRHEW